ncbi:AAA family ATPase [Idiomarina loihiensis]|uniref:AAA family ATPase n=1 Tax=Idiomarina loihiensis TaxID=135577 RepID=UPI00129CCCA1|nr:ATP-binding protein [Idiomarina loihiensis]MRJ44855.1 AAA family ATPase [Idiomarina loihiensis]UTW33190.1 AAA family ATPase [Idiomarina loihiensis]
MSNEIYINKIKIKEVRNIKGFEIPLSGSLRKHLILTGKNGSGKTTLLLEINRFLENVFNGQYANWDQQKHNLKNLESNLKQLESRNPSKNDGNFVRVQRNVENAKKWFERFGGLEIGFSSNIELQDKAQQGEFLIAYFDAKRTTSINVPSGINKVNLKDKYQPKERANAAFIQYIVNLKAERSFARDDEDVNEVKRIDEWFSRFERRLGEILEAPELKLTFDRKNYNFKIDVNGREPYTLSELSDGHSAILSILTELILRMEAKSNASYNMQGIVLIDEIETHLHVDLQKKILPFLSDFFPNLQFIITTHSPFVLSSIESSVVCDLQNRIVTEDLSGYSYDALIESYFSSNKYSEKLIEKINKFEWLSKNRKEEDNAEYHYLKNYLSQLPKYLSKELHVKLQQIELTLLNEKGE